MQLISETLTGQQEAIKTNQAIERGISLESTAKDRYRLYEFDATIKDVGFIEHPTIELFGASPDGLVNHDGLLEIKCPNTTTHLETLITKKPKEEYILQMHGQMMCTGRNWCDFVSYDDRLPIDLAYFKTRIIRDNIIINKIEVALTEFIRILKLEINRLTNSAPTYQIPIAANMMPCDEAI